MARIDRFKGLNNVSDPLRLGLAWLATADNVNITDSGALAKRAGYVLNRAGAFTSAYSTLDFSRSYLATALGIQDFTGENIAALTSSAPMYWAEVNEHVYFNNGVDSGVILPDNTVLPWRWATPSEPALAAVSGSLAAGTYQVLCTHLLADGRETGASDVATLELAEGQALQISGIPQRAGVRTNVYIAPANSDVFQLYATTGATALVFNASPDTLGRDLLNAFLDPLPAGSEAIQFWGGRAYAAQYMPSENQTAVWFSEALGYHLFNLNSGFFLVPGVVLAMAPTKDALIVATGERIYAYSGDKLEQLAPYGTVSGKPWDMDGERLLMWTTRGLCAINPFENLTERQVSVAPGVHAAGCVVRSGGQKRFVATIQQGKEAFNAYL